MRNMLAIAIAVVGLAGTGTALAVPCGSILSVGGVIPSDGCQDGAANDTSASESDLNNGAYFGFSNWSLLDVATRSGSDPANASIWSSNYAFGGRAGIFTLSNNLSSLFSDLVVVLADNGGSYTNAAIKWSAYLLGDTIANTYAWSYDNRNRVGSLSLFGVPTGQTSGAPNGTAVPEPATLSLVLLGLGLTGWLYRRRRA